MDPWPHSEAGRFHRGISLAVVLIAGLVLAAETIRNHAPLELAVLGAVFAGRRADGLAPARGLPRQPGQLSDPCSSPAGSPRTRPFGILEIKRDGPSGEIGPHGVRAGQPRLVRELLGMGASGFLAKSASPAELIAAVKRSPPERPPREDSGELPPATGVYTE